MEPIADANFLPVAQAAPARHARATFQLLRQHLPGDAAIRYNEDPREGDPFKGHGVGHPWA